MAVYVQCESRCRVAHVALNRFHVITVLKGQSGVGVAEIMDTGIRRSGFRCQLFKWKLIKPYAIGNKGTWSGNAKNTRVFINRGFWLLWTEA